MNRLYVMMAAHFLILLAALVGVLYLLSQDANASYGPFLEAPVLVQAYTPVPTAIPTEVPHGRGH